jgi:hypothetical protein
MEGTMQTAHPARWALALLACLALGACKQQREPVKPMTGAVAVQAGA